MLLLIKIINIYIIQYKDAKHKLESLHSELDGIKRMIQKNLVAKDQPVDLVADDVVVHESTHVPSQEDVEFSQPLLGDGSRFLNTANAHFGTEEE